MKEQLGNTYASANLAKMLIASDAKVGKTSYLIASALGLFPGQTNGGIVDSPSNLHVVTFDEAALRGVNDFLTRTCKAPASALAFKVYNMEEDFKKITVSPDAYDRDFYNLIVRLASNLKQRCKSGTPVILISSLTSMAEGIVRGTIGPAGEKKGSGGDQAKWSDFAMQMTELRNHVHSIPAHILWEAHVYKVPLKNGQSEMDETLQIPGRTGVNFAANVSYVARLRRMFNQKVANSNADQVYLDTKSSFSFASGGRGFINLEPREADLTEVFEKLGLQVGGWKPSVTRATNNVRTQVRKEQ